MYLFFVFSLTQTQLTKGLTLILLALVVSVDINFQFIATKVECVF